MAFLTDKNDNIWIADSLNARILAISADKSNAREIDIEKVGKELGLASIPVLLDMVPGPGNRLILADAQNNAVISLDLQKNENRVFLPDESGEKAHWIQINRIHSDAQGKIYIEDLPSMRTVVIDSEGKLLNTLEGEIGIAVDVNGRAAMIVNDIRKPNMRSLVMSPSAGAPAELLTSFVTNETIVWASVIGFTKDRKLFCIFDTEKIRNYVVFDHMGQLTIHKKVKFPDPGYDPARPDWISPSGDIYTVKVASDSFSVLKLN
jgi:sugar lactone lactonase YvrE